MWIELGHYLLILGVFLSVFQTFFSWWPVFVSSSRLQVLARPIAHSQTVIWWAIFFILIYAFIISDFSLKLALQNSHSLKPLFYKISGVWGNHEGSMVLFVVILTTWTTLFIRNGKGEISSFHQKVLGWQGIITCFLGLFILLSSNPFLRVFPPAAEGLGLNPILQHPGLVIHPPILYMGYVGASLVFSITLALMVQKKVSKKDIESLRFWAFIPWAFLTLGIGIGSWWAYYELGWGGWWFWDPVENASLLPWLGLTILLHLAGGVIYKDKGHIPLFFFGIISFIMTLFATFLVRAGVVASVHSFASDPERGLFILIFVTMLSSVAYTIFGLYAPSYREQPRSDGFFTKLMGIKINYYLFSLVLFLIMFGLTFPFFAQIWQSQSFQFDETFYHATVLPFGFLILITMGAFPLFSWQPKASKQYKHLYAPLALSFISLGIAWLFGEPISAEQGAWLFATAWLFWATLYLFLKISNFQFSYIINSEAFKLWIKAMPQIPRKKLQMFVAHFGFSILAIGMVGSTLWQDFAEQQVTLQDKVRLNGYVYTFSSLTEGVTDNYQWIEAKIEIRKNGDFVADIFPGKRVYPSTKTITTEAAVHSTLLIDHYITFTKLQWNEKDEPIWQIQVRQEPLVMCIWLGCILIFFSIFLFKLRIK